MIYALFMPDGMPLAYYTAAMPPTLEQMAERCGEIKGFAIVTNGWMSSASDIVVIDATPKQSASKRE